MDKKEMSRIGKQPVLMPSGVECKVNGSKVDVKGTNAHPFYSWASTKMGIMSVPRWNFHKYLISTEGKLVDWFSSTTSPVSTKVLEAIKKQLPRS